MRFALFLYRGGFPNPFPHAPVPLGAPSVIVKAAHVENSCTPHSD